jgi:hypothetical protein
MALIRKRCSGWRDSVHLTRRRIHRTTTGYCYSTGGPDFEFCSDQAPSWRYPANNEGGKAHSEDVAGTDRLKPIAMFEPIEEGFQRGAENRSRCPLLTLSVPLRPRRDAPSLLLSGFSIELEAQIWFDATQRRDLRAMKTRPCARGKINAPPRANMFPAPFRLFLGRQSFKRLIGRRKSGELTS